MLKALVVLNCIVAVLLSATGYSAAAVSVAAVSSPLAAVSFVPWARKRLWHEMGASLQGSGGSQWQEFKETVSGLYRMAKTGVSHIFRKVKDLLPRKDV